MTHVNRNSYVGPGVDGAVMMAQAEKRRDHDNETTIVHKHRHGAGCTLDCRVIEPGFLTRSVGEEKTPVKEEMY